MLIESRSDEDTTKIPDVSIVEASAELLYGLCHQRYILTRAGLQAMVSSQVLFDAPRDTDNWVRLRRSTSTRPVSSVLVHAFIATDAISFLVAAPICPDWTPSSCSARTATTSTPLQAVDSRVLMVRMRINFSYA